jgi:hypothetical protein
MTNARTWFKGNEVEYTGRSEFLYGALFYEVVVVSGLNRGEVFVIIEAPKA